jgi:plasmid stability protein
MPAAMTLKNIPDELYERLKTAARTNHRSMNKEAIACLEQALSPNRKSPEEVLAGARQVRASLKGRTLKASDVEKAINWGRARRSRVIESGGHK